MSKAKQILALLKEGRLPDKKIAEGVGCHIAYVRVVRQRYNPDNRERFQGYMRSYYLTKRVGSPEARAQYNDYHRVRRAIRKARADEGRA